MEEDKNKPIEKLPDEVRKHYDEMLLNPPYMSQMLLDYFSNNKTKNEEYKKCSNCNELFLHQDENDRCDECEKEFKYKHCKDFIGTWIKRIQHQINTHYDHYEYKPSLTQWEKEIEILKHLKNELDIKNGKQQ